MKVRPNPLRKRMTREELARRKEQAVRFLETVLDDPERADEVAEEPLESYAERRRIELTNPGKREVIRMARQKRDELIEENERLVTALGDLRDEIDDLLEDYESEEEGETAE